MSKLIIDDLDAFVSFVEEHLENGEGIREIVESYKNQTTVTLPDGIVIVLNYSPKTHAIFGNTKEIKDKLMALNEGGKKLVSYNAKLSFGAGWVIMDKTRLSEITEMLEENAIEYTQVEKSKFEAKVEKKPAPKSKAVAKPKVVDSDVGSDEEAPKAAAKPAPKSKNVTKAKVSDLENDSDVGSDEEKPAPKSKAKAVAKSAPKTKAVAKASAKAKTVTDDEKPAPKKKVVEKPSPKSKKTMSKPAVESEEEAEDVDYSTFTVAQLKALLKDKGLLVSGKKDELIARLSSPSQKVAKPKAVTESIKDKAPPKSKKTTAKPLPAVKNAHGNHEEHDTGFVFEKLPIGPGGTDVSVAVGIQNPDSEEMGIDSLTPLDDEMIEQCNEKVWRYLTDDMLPAVKAVDEELYEKLEALQSRRNESLF